LADNLSETEYEELSVWIEKFFAGTESTV
jgi:hypothetical protein